MTDAINQNRMNTVAIENQCSGQKMPAKNVTVIDTSAAKAPVRLEVASWQVAPAQNVAILDSSEKTADHVLPTMAATDIPPGATARAA
jgi:hypothetical protein